MNTSIRQSAQSATFSCDSCDGWINPTASHPKDQELPCGKCHKLYHKRCTDRRKSTSNWRKPWYCPDCIRGNDAPPLTSQHGIHATGTTLNPSAISFSPQVTLSPQHSDRHQQDQVRADTLNIPTEAQGTRISDILPETSELHRAQNNPIQDTSTTSTHAQITEALITTITTLQPSTSSSTLASSSAPTLPTPSLATVNTTSQPQRNPTSNQTQPRFPSTATRQRSSNINLSDPEIEFHKTALSACRSTISQQETELKRLNECLDIRNKRIQHLESQVGHASEYISARAPSSDIAEDRLRSLSDKIEWLCSKIERLEHPSPPNNIFINSCKADSLHTRMQHMSTQTDDTAGNTLSTNEEGNTSSETYTGVTSGAHTNHLQASL